MNSFYIFISPFISCTYSSLAQSLGNHEFDDGLKGLFPFLKNLNPKVVVCNINSSKVPEFADYVTPSIILEVGGERIGVIGYLTPETKFLSSSGISPEIFFQNIFRFTICVIYLLVSCTALKSITGKSCVKSILSHANNQFVNLILAMKMSMIMYLTK